MKNIKYFKYKNKNAFKLFLSACGYKFENVVGFSFIKKQQYRGNVLKLYFIHFNDGKKKYFKVVFFKNFNEWYQSRFISNCIELTGWCSADVVKYKTKCSGWYSVTN